MYGYYCNASYDNDIFIDSFQLTNFKIIRIAIVQKYNFNM